MNIWDSYICTADIHFKQMEDHRSNVLNLSSWENKALEGIEPMTSAIQVQRSNQLSYQANWELGTCEFVIYPWMGKIWNEYMKFIYLYCG